MVFVLARVCASALAQHRGGRDHDVPIERNVRSPASQPRRAATIVAMSIFLIVIIASNARLAAAGSESEIASVNALV